MSAEVAYRGQSTLDDPASPRGAASTARERPRHTRDDVATNDQNEQSKEPVRR
jgi:hypothetical protein